MASQLHESTKSTEAGQPRTRSSAILLLATMADTTWRMFVPIIGLLVLGLLADKQFGSTPWLMIIGLLAGIALSALLIRRQFQGVRKNKS